MKQRNQALQQEGYVDQKTKGHAAKARGTILCSSKRFLLRAVMRKTYREEQQYSRFKPLPEKREPYCP